uniref:ShKT domain-containing protein n=1 Tax=Acrobeloides nanus TaxID=290746 RepID=A0A914EJE6_9BILA
MFRIVLISFVVALSLSLPLIPDVGDVINEITDITDNVTDAVKAVNPSIVKNKGGPPHSGHKVKDEVLASLLFQDDMFLTEPQLDQIIENTAAELGWSKDVLKKLGVTTRSKRQAIKNAPNDNHWTSPISYYFDSNIRKFAKAPGLLNLRTTQPGQLNSRTTHPGQLNPGQLNSKTTITRDVIRQVFAFYANHTCLKFQESSTAIPRIQFRNVTSGCFSYVGFLGNSWYGAPSSQTGCTSCSGNGQHPVNLGANYCDDEASTTTDCQTLKTSLGTDNDVTNLYLQKAWYHIKAPTGKKVQLFFAKAGGSPGKSDSTGWGCNNNGVEIKLKSGQFNRTGNLFCGDDSAIISTKTNPIPLTSDSELAILQLYTRFNQFNLDVKYRYVDSTTSSTVPESCKPCLDRYSNCADFISSCSTDATMPVDCPVTCGTCPGAGSIATTAQPITCVNVDSDADCDYWKSQGYCSSSSQYYSYMTQNCPKSCGTCSAPPTQPPCVNSGAADADCNYWAGLGYCATSSVYYTWMTQNCQKACATC